MQLFSRSDWLVYLACDTKAIRWWYQWYTGIDRCATRWVQEKCDIGSQRRIRGAYHPCGNYKMIKWLLRIPIWRDRLEPLLMFSSVRYIATLRPITPAPTTHTLQSLIASSLCCQMTMLAHQIDPTIIFRYEKGPQVAAKWHLRLTDQRCCEADKCIRASGIRRYSKFKSTLEVSDRILSRHSDPRSLGNFLEQLHRVSSSSWAVRVLAALFDVSKLNMHFLGGSRITNSYQRRNELRALV